MHSRYIQKTDADVNSISGCSWTFSYMCRGKKIFSLLKQIISERETGANMCTTSVIKNVAEKQWPVKCKCKEIKMFEDKIGICIAAH